MYLESIIRSNLCVLCIHRMPCMCVRLFGSRKSTFSIKLFGVRRPLCTLSVPNGYALQMLSGRSNCKTDIYLFPNNWIGNSFWCERERSFHMFICNVYFKSFRSVLAQIVLHLNFMCMLQHLFECEFQFSALRFVEFSTESHLNICEVNEEFATLPTCLI